ncbi:MAG: CHAT domain-containing protein [Psychroflexus sp.]|nr:CHAT domain-containing protein [Psychroflexus sp.]MDN6309680.1 CHAT domain-containing protein [Psychroflexus sp.]
MRNLYHLIFCFFILCALQVHSQNLEDSIYNSLDAFVATPDEENLDKLKLEIKAISQQNLKSKEKLAVIIAQCNMGYYSNKYNQTQQAISLYETAWSSYQKHNFKNYDMIEFCLKPLGNLYTKTGNFSQAENTIKIYINAAQKNNNQQQEIAGIINLSVVYHNTGHFNMAIDILEKKIKKSNLNAKQKKALENNLTTNLIALKSYEEAQKLISKNIGKPLLATEYKNAAQLALQKKEFQEAEEYLKLAEKALRKDPNITARKLAKLYTEKADVYLAQQEFTKAENSFLNALNSLLPHHRNDVFTSQELLYPENTFLSIFDGLAQLQEDWQKALDYYDLSFYVSDMIAENITSQHAKITHLSATKERSEACLAILFEQTKTAKDSSILEKALQYAEESKAAILKENRYKQALALRYPEDSLIKKRQKLEHQQQSFINKIIRHQLSGKKPPEKLMTDLNKTNLSLNKAKAVLNEKYPDKKSMPIALNALQKQLDSDAAEMRLFFFGQRTVYHFSITKNTATFEKTGEAKHLRKLIQKYLYFFEEPSLINTQISDYKESAYSLYKGLKFKKNNSENIIIIPDGLLSFIPFGALLTQKHKGIQFEKMPFLIREKPIIYQTAASFYLDKREMSHHKKRLGIFPIFEGTPYELRYSVEEAESFKKQDNSEILYKSEATKAAFLKKAAAYNILHLSTHAQGGNYTIPASLAFYDETLLLPELYTLNLNPELIVLSACETGIGKIQGGEGAMSLARGFQYAGAKNLLFSLWQVNDKATAELMTSFYGHFESSKSKSSSLYQTKGDYLLNPRLKNPKKSPYYWAGFVYYGEIEAAQDTGSTQMQWIVFMILCVILCIFLLLRKRKLTKNKAH